MAETTALDTPPSSSDIETSANLPPSPPLSPAQQVANKRKSLTAVDRLIGSLKLHRRGKLDTESEWLVLKLSQREYEDFEQRLGSDEVLRGWFEDKVRYDWDQERGEFVLRLCMPSALHERFKICVEEGIDQVIEELAGRLEGSGDQNDAEIARELRRVYNGGHTIVELQVPKLLNSSQESADSDGGEKVVKRSPDATWYHPSQPDVPTLVVEVAYSQSQKDLPKLAESYIIDSSHAIRAVLGFKLPYQPRQSEAKAIATSDSDGSAWFSLWRPRLEAIVEDSSEVVGTCSQEVKGSFRSLDGEPDVASLELKVSDLLPADLPPLEISSAQDLSISIPLDKLAQLLDEAEAEAPKPAKSNKRKTPTTFRKRKRTPSEELSEGREEMYARQEMAELAKDAAVDGEYVDATRRVRRRRSTRNQQRVAGGAENLTVRAGERGSGTDTGDAG